MNKNRKRLVIIVDYAEDGSAQPDLTDVALETEVRLKEAFGFDLDATVFNDDKSAIAYLEAHSPQAKPPEPPGPHGYTDYENEPIGGGNPYYRCVHCKRSDPEINGRLEGHESWCQYRLAQETAGVTAPAKAPLPPDFSLDHRINLADQAFESYDFGPTVEIVDHDNWNTEDVNDLTKIAYATFTDMAAEDSFKISFHARFSAETGELAEAYALDVRHGQELGFTRA
jgi:hypothetical protein